MIKLKLNQIYNVQCIAIAFIGNSSLPASVATHAHAKEECYGSRTPPKNASAIC